MKRIQRAAAGELDHWAETAEGALALVIVLDQFSRDLNRGSAAAFANDPKTLSIAETAIEKGWDQQFPEPNEVFFYLPLEHSEDIEVQRRCFDFVREDENGHGIRGSPYEVDRTFWPLPAPK